MAHTRGMTETPSGNRWEPAGDGTQPIAPAAPASPPAAPPPPATTPQVEYGWAPAPHLGPATSAPVTPVTPVTPAAPAGRPGRRRTGLLTAVAAAVVLGSSAVGYAAGSATAGSERQDVGTTRQAPPNGVQPGQGAPGQPDSGDDDDRFGGSDHDSDDDEP